jgi:hypothetical protein
MWANFCLAQNPAFDALRADPRFDQVLEVMRH